MNAAEARQLARDLFPDGDETLVDWRATLILRRVNAPPVRDILKAVREAVNKRKAENA